MNMSVLAVLLLAVSVLAADNMDYHDTLDDNFDFTTLTKDQFKAAVACLIDEGPCSELQYSYRKHYPAAVEEGCSRCNRAQKRTAYVYFDRAAKELPEEFNKIKKKYDPMGKYFDNFMQVLKSA